MEVRKNYTHATERTVDELRTIAHAIDMRELSEISLPQIEAVAELVEQFTPAAEARGLILNGLTRLPQRHAPPAHLNSELYAWLQFLENWRDKAIYGTFFVAPATVLWGYQHILKLAGRQPEEAFPEGYWQFYVNYALREDTARHAHETHGFDTVLKRHDLHLSENDRVTAWVMAAIYSLHSYDQLLHNEWRERVYTGTLRNLTADTPHARRTAALYRHWERERPYRRGPDVIPGQDYATYRRTKFDEFIERTLNILPEEIRRSWVYAVRQAKEQELPLYQKQMSLLTYLESGVYGETRRPIGLEQAYVGIIHQQRYYLIPACQPDTLKPADVMTVRAQVAAILGQDKPTVPAVDLTHWARAKRAYVPHLRQQIGPANLAELDLLHQSPILLNLDQRPFYLELAELRQAERGTGSHAITIFNTGESFVFDFSHIFFDGTWGAALAEIITNEATAWGVYLNTLPNILPPSAAPRALNIRFSAAELSALQTAPTVTREASAETESINLQNLLALRRIFKLRNDLIQLTVNDLLVLYRAIHAFTYRPDARLVQDLRDLLGDERTRAAAEQALAVLDHTNTANPSSLIPVDASQQTPRDRVHPMTFQVPIHELHLLDLHEQVVSALNHYKQATYDRDEAYQEFDELQRHYLAALAGCGLVFSRAKEIAALGASNSVGTIRLLAHLPVPLQRLLDKIPNRFDVLNDLIKGREVFSNIGMVASNSTLLRFMSAKDDNENKTLAWGVLTDAEGMMRITLRDFRPHVQQLTAVGHAALATRLVQDYLNAYASGLNDYVRDLRRMTMASRETRMVSDVGLLDG